jgi:hypothetical protein
MLNQDNLSSKGSQSDEPRERVHISYKLPLPTLLLSFALVACVCAIEWNSLQEHRLRAKCESLLAQIEEGKAKFLEAQNTIAATQEEVDRLRRGTAELHILRGKAVRLEEVESELEEMKPRIEQYARLSQVYTDLRRKYLELRDTPPSESAIGTQEAAMNPNHRTSVSGIEPRVLFGAVRDRGSQIQQGMVRSEIRSLLGEPQQSKPGEDSWKAEMVDFGYDIIVFYDEFETCTNVVSVTREPSPEAAADTPY